MKLDVLQTISDALRELAAHARTLARAVALPVLLIALSDLDFIELSGVDSLTWPLVYVAALTGYVFLAVSTHRVLLLGSDSLPNAWGLHVGTREIRFVGWSFGISLLVLPIALVVGLAVVPLLDLAPAWIFLATAALWIPGAYVTSRASLVLPATAMGRRPSLAEAWSLSSGNGWRLTVALGLPALITWALTWAASQLDTDIGLLEQFATSVVFAVLGVVEVAALSVAYRSLSSGGARAAA